MWQHGELVKRLLPVSICCTLAVLTSCGASSDEAGPTTGTPGTTAATTVTSPQTSAATVTTEASPPSTASATTNPAVVSEAPITSPGIGQCTTASLDLTFGDPDGALGSSYTPLVFTNRGTAICTLDGHPGVSFVDDAGNQIGPSAERTSGTTPTVALAPGEQAHATLQTHHAGVFGEECVAVSAHRMKVYPPDQTEAIIIEFPFDVCTGAIPDAQIMIYTVEPGSTD